MMTHDGKVLKKSAGANGKMMQSVARGFLHGTGFAKDPTDILRHAPGSLSCVGKLCNVENSLVKTKSRIGELVVSQHRGPPSYAWFY